MRKLGQALGVEAMSLYRYVAGRDDVLDGIVDLVVGEIELPGPGARWKEAMRQRAISAHEVLLAASLGFEPDRVAEERQPGEAALCGHHPRAACGRRAFRSPSPYRAFFTLDSYIYGFTLQEVNRAVPAEDLPQVTARLRPQVPADVYTNLAEFMEHLARSKRSKRPGSGARASRATPADFAFGLDLILDGLERLSPPLRAGQRAR